MSPWFALLLAGPLVLLPLAAYCFVQRRVKGARWYGLLLLTIAWWSLTYAWELSADDVAIKALALRIKYVGVVLLPPAWIGFILEFVDAEPARLRARVMPMIVVAVVVLTLVWSDPWHGLFWGPMTVQRVGEYLVLRGRGPGFWINVSYTYITLAAGLVLLVLHAVHSPHLYGRRTAILMTGALIPWAGNLVFMINREESIVDPTPFLFSCTTLVAALAVFRYDLLEPVPTLREARIESVGDGVLIVDRRGRVADVNAAAEALLECPRAEAAGRPVRELLGDWPAGELPDHPFELTVPHGDRNLTLDARCTAVQSPAGRVTGTVVILRDVTEERDRERLRERLLEEAQAANVRRDEFLAAVSHEMRTPLNAVVGWTHLLRRGQVDDTRMDHALSVIERNARAQARLVDDLLDWSGLAGGHTRLTLEQASVLHVVQEALDAVSPSAGARQISIAREMQDSLPEIQADPDRLRQVVWNLLANAIKFTPEGGHITLRVRRLADLIELTVTDTGKGIAPEFLPHVFEPFRQADSRKTGDSHGLGLGLTIVRRIVEAHGGRVDARSDGLGKGATFCVWLPISG
jgi:signal transduction histidine kinase